MRVGEALYYAALAVVLLLVLNRFGASPVGVYLVASPSMEPALKPLDLVVAVKWGAIKPGDIAVYCRTPALCIVHRVIRVGSGYIQTKGDANPAPDPPVPLNRVRGRVVLVVPRPAVAAAVLALVTGLLWEAARRGAPLYAVVILLVLAPIVAVAVYEHPLLYLPSGFEAPDIALSSVYLDPSCHVVIAYNARGDSIARVLDVRVDGVPAAYELAGDTIIVDVPYAALRRLPGALTVNASVETARGLLVRGSYRVPAPFKPPTVRVVGGAVMVHNPNCYPIRIRATVYYAVGGRWAHYTVEREVEGYSTSWIRPPKARAAYVDLSGPALGVRVWVGGGG